ncbi:hypothetical protein ACTFIY_002619 [Dictyostelium cf. discoideum]
MNKILTLFILFISLFLVCEATHFRFGTMSWMPMGSHNTIKFTSNYAFRIGFFKKFDKGCKVGDVVKVGDLDLGDSETVVDVNLVVTSVNVVDNWFTGEFSYTHTYDSIKVGKKAATYKVVFTDCCRIKSLLNNPEGSWYVSTSVVVDPNQGSDVSTFNRSPVSGMVPIITLNRDKNNQFLIPASDPNGDKLTYSLSNAYTMDQPPGLSIDSNSGIVSFKPVSSGFYSTQIMIKDTKGAYVVVDFLINSVIEPGVCHPSCSNSGSSCNGNSGCKSCKGTDSNGNTCSSFPPVFVYPPTPIDGALLAYEINNTYSFSIQCKTEDKSKTSFIQPANIPLAATLSSSIQNKQISTLTYSMTPQLKHIGVYVITAYCTDNTGLVSTVTSFSISVEKPICGNGSNKPGGGCNCETGWDPEKNCYECLKGHFGEKCDPVDPCVNGESNEGSQGDGKCTCYYGWEGKNCDIKVNQVCNANKENVVLDSSVAKSSYINPNFAQVYLNTDPSKQALTLPSKLSIPETIDKFEVLVVVDSQPGMIEYWDNFKKYSSDLTKNLQDISETVSIGLGLFSDAKTNGYSFVLKKSIGNGLSGLDDKDRAPASTYSTKNSLIALSSAAEFPAGWSTGSIKIIVLLTDNDYSATTQEVSKFTSTLISKSILPVVVSFNDNQNWATLFKNQGFGSTKKTANSKGSDWVSVATTGINDVLSKAVVKSIDDTNEFLTLPAATTISIENSNDYTLPIQIKYPQGQSNILQNPSVSYSVVGFGITKIVINYNSAPTALGYLIETKQNVNYNFKLSGSDVDGNTLTIKFKTIPAASVGVIQADGLTIKQGDSFPIEKTFTFKPATNYYTKSTNDKFTFVVNDGCLDSNEATVEIKITHVNQAPSCSSLSGSAISATGLNTPISFSLKGSDIESDSNLKIVFGDLTALSAYGSIKSGSNVSSTGSSVQLSSGVASLTFTQTKDITNDKEITIDFKVNDGSLDSTPCSFKVKFVHFNKPPVAFAQTPLTIRQNAELKITISASDSDSVSVVFTLDSLQPGEKGRFYKCSDQSPLTAPFTTQPVSISGGVASFSEICYFSPLENADSYASLVFLANDGQLASEKFKVLINVNGNRDNHPPVVNQIPNFIMNEDDISNELVIDGIDQDTLDIGKLKGIITKKPMNGVILVKSGSSSSEASVIGNAPYKIFYKPNPLYYGTDSFSYTVEDSMGERDANPKTTQITIQHVNHAPTLSIDPYDFTSQTSEKTLELTPKDIDLIDTVFHCTIIKLPATATLKTSDGEVIDFVPTDLSDNKYIITANKNIYNDFSDSFDAKCYDSSNAVSNVATGPITFKYINVPPKAESSDETLNQDSSVSFSVKATDLEDNSNVLAVIRSLPAKGTLTIKSTGKAAEISSTYPLDDFVYTPIPGYSNWDKPGHVGPADSFNFVAKDSKNDISSNIGTVSFFIDPRNPPSYEGLTYLYTKENTDLPFSITGIVGNGGSNVFLRIKSIESRGSLYATHCMATEGCMSEPNPVDINKDFTSQPYTFSFTPIEYENGENYAIIKFVLYDKFKGQDVESQQYTIIINVIPVNQAPEIILIEHTLSTQPNNVITFDKSNTIKMETNSRVIIKYDGTDIDDPKSNLTSYILSPPLRGSLYVYDKDAKDGLGKLIKKDDTLVPVAQDNFWYIVFVPTPGTSGDGYVRIPISIVDFLGEVSVPATVTVDVSKKNIPPFITIENKKYTSLANTSIVVTGVSFDDPDSEYNDVQLILSLVNKDGDLVSNKIATFSLSQENQKKCTKDSKFAQFTCKSNKKSLKALISTMYVNHQGGGSYRLKVFVNDLGYSSPASIRDKNHMTATDYVELEVTKPEVTTTKENNNKTVLTGAIAGAAAGAGLLAAGAWFLLKKSAPPTDAFFGEGAFADGAVSTNPMYEESGKSAINPLYEASSDNL